MLVMVVVTYLPLPLTPIIRTSSATGSSANLIGIINNDEVDGGGGGELTEVRWPLPN